MGTYVVRPTTYLYQSGGWDKSTDTGATWAAATNAQIATYLGDNLDTTGLRAQASSGSSYWRASLAAPTIPADEFVARVGASVRWSHGQAGKYVGAVAYTTLGAVPGGIGVIQVDGGTTATTSEIGQSISQWTKAQVAKLALYGLASGGSTTAVRPRLWDSWATVYTIKQATAVPQARTETTSTTPTITVDTTATIDWEAFSWDWQDLRKVTVEVRLESGGTGAGTGTFLGSATADYLFTVTGTVSIPVTVPVSLANGTYKIYARATRYRDANYGFTVQSEQVSAWSTAATLTMSVTPPVAPTLTTSVNQTTDVVTVNVTPVASGTYTSPVFTLERSNDSGATWSSVRTGINVSGTFGSATPILDYEAVQGTAVQYRARVTATTGGFTYTGPYSTVATATVNLGTWNLKCPETPSLNLSDAWVLGHPEETISEDVGVFRPLDRRLPVIVAGTLTGWDSAITVHAPDAATWLKLEALIESQKVLYLESPFGWAKYVRIMPGAKAVMLGTTTAPRREVAFAYVETDAPAAV